MVSFCVLHFRHPLRYISKLAYMKKVSEMRNLLRSSRKFLSVEKHLLELGTHQNANALTLGVCLVIVHQRII